MVKYVFLFHIVLLMMSCKEDSTSNGLIETPVESKTIKNSFEDLEGNPINLTDYKGKKILLNFWATWCKPCVEEMPSLERCKVLLEKENYVVLLASNESQKEIKSFKNETNYKLDFIRHAVAISELKIHALPTTFIYNEKGEKVTKMTGVQNWDSPEMILKLKNIK